MKHAHPGTVDKLHRAPVTNGELDVAIDRPLLVRARNPPFRFFSLFPSVATAMQRLQPASQVLVVNLGV